MDNTKGIGRPPHSTPSVSKGKNYILAIGIDHYDNHRSLKNAVADAKAFVDLMTNRYGFVHLNEPLYDKTATQRNIRKALGKCESLGEHDRLIVFYSGHGWFKKASKIGYLVPTEAEDDPNSDFIPVNFVTNIFQSVAAHHILLIVDCCFGGSFGLERNVIVDAETTKVVSELDKKKSRMVLSSGGIEPVSDGLIRDNNSPFTKPLIEILRDNQAEKTVFSEFFALLRKKTNWNAEQLPQYKVLQHLGHADGELALFCTDLETPEERAYNTAMKIQSISLLTNFIKDFPKSDYKVAVRTLLKEKKAEVKWEKIKNSQHYEDFDEFVDDFPDSSFATIARQKMNDWQFMDEETERLRLEKAEKERQAKAEKAEADRRERERLAKIEADKKEQERQYQAEIKRQQEAAARKKQEAAEKERQKQALLAQLMPEMVLVKGGSFNREYSYEGSTLFGLSKTTKIGTQKVTLTDFSIGKYPITVKEYLNFVQETKTHLPGWLEENSNYNIKTGNGDRYKQLGEALQKDNHPIVGISWDAATAYSDWLSKKTGKKYRLLTEAEWEFAARGGNQSKGFEYSGSNNIDEVAWYHQNSDSKTHPVGTKKANELGIYDMSGNVWEWCNDWYGDYNNTDITNPKGAKTGSARVIRGGSWGNDARHCRVAPLYYYSPTNCFGTLGFRLGSSLQ